MIENFKKAHPDFKVYEKSINKAGVDISFLPQKIMRSL